VTQKKRENYCEKTNGGDINARTPDLFSFSGQDEGTAGNQLCLLGTRTHHALLAR